MKRPIKFRGRVHESDPLDSGKIVFGSFVDYGTDYYKYRYWIYPTEGDRNFPIDEDSIAQLIGYDKNGREVYEGDKYIYFNGRELKAEMSDIYVVQDCKLVEATND